MGFHRDQDIPRKPSRPPKAPERGERHELKHLHAIEDRLDAIEKVLKALYRGQSTIKSGVRDIMADLQSVKDQLAQAKLDAETERQQAADRAAAASAQADAQTAEIQRLNDLLASGTAVTPDDLDALLTSGQEISEAIKGIIPDAPATASARRR